MSNPEEETIEILYNQGMGMKFCLSEEAYERFVELKVQNDPEYNLSLIHISEPTRPY